MVKGKYYDAFIANNEEQARTYFNKISSKWGIPIIMIGDVFKNKEYIRFSISLFNYLIKNGFASSETDDEKFSFIVNTINEVYMLFKYQMTFLNNDKVRKYLKK